MAKNTFKQVDNKANNDKVNRKPNAIIAWVNHTFNIEQAVNKLPKQYLYYGIWLFILAFIYIYFSLKYEKYIREVDKLKIELDEKRAEYTSQKAGFMKATKQSEVRKIVEKMGIIENEKPPQKIKIADSELTN